MAASATSAEALQLALELMGEDASLSGVAEGFRRRIREFLREHGPIALTRDCMPGHLTASCLLWDAAGERVLLHDQTAYFWTRSAQKRAAPSDARGRGALGGPLPNS